MIRFNTGFLHLSRLWTQTVKTNFSYLKKGGGFGLESRAVSSISFLPYKWQWIPINSLLPFCSCKDSATIPTLLQLHKPATLLVPPWAYWKKRGRCEWATLNATPSAQIGRFSQKQLHLWLPIPVFHNLPSLLWRSTVSPSFHWIYFHQTECQDVTLNTKCSADVVPSAPLWAGMQLGKPHKRVVVLALPPVVGRDDDANAPEN